MPPKHGFSLKLFISIIHETIGCLLSKNNQENHKQTIYYLSRMVTEVEIKYCYIMFGLVLLMHESKPLFDQFESFVISQTDLVKYMLYTF